MKIFFAKKNIPIYIIFIFVFLTYSQLIKNDFINWDDDVNIYNCKTYFEDDVLRRIWLTFEMPSYLPVTDTLWYLQVKTFTLKKPQYFHIVSILFHILNVLLLYFIFLKMKIRRFHSLIMVLIFAIHPLKLENVAWVTEQKTIFSSFFILLMWIVFEYKLFNKSNFKYNVLMHFIYIFAILSKPVSVTFPVVLFLLSLIRIKNNFVKSIKQFISIFFIGFALTSVIYFGEVSSKFSTQNIYSFLEKIFLIFRIFIAYIYNFYYLKFPDVLYLKWNLSLSAINYTYGIIFLLLVIFTCYSMKNEKIRIFGLYFICFFILLFPVLGIVRLPYFFHSFIAGRFMYIPSIFIMLFSYEFVMYFYNLIRSKQKNIYKNIIIISIFCFLGYSFYITYKISFVWRNSISFWEYLTKTNNGVGHPTAFYNNGLIQMNKGNNSRAKIFFKKSLSLKSDYIDAYVNIGNIEAEKQNFGSAKKYYSKAISIYPLHSIANYNIANIYFEEKKYVKAISHYEKALKENPKFKYALINLEKCLQAKKNE